MDGNDQTSIIVTVTAQVNESGSGLDRAGSYLKSPGGGSSWSWATISEDGTEAVFVFTLDPKTASGQYYIDDIRLEDLAGNQGFYNSSEIQSINLNSIWSIDNPVSDNSSPAILSLEFLAIGENTSKEINIKAVLDAQETAIKRIYIRMTSPNSISIDKDFPITDPNGSNFELQFSLPSEFPNGTYVVDYIFTEDNALNNIQYSKSDLDSLSINSSITFD